MKRLILFLNILFPLVISAQVVTNGLVLHVDANDGNSYSGNGNTWTDLTGNGNNIILNGPTFRSTNETVAKYFEFDGTDDFEGTEVYKIKMTKTPYLIDGEENPNIDYYLFDMDNYVLLAVWSEMLEGPGKGAVIQQSFSDYQEVEGVYYPFSLTFGAKGQPGGQTFVVQNMEINPELDDSDFKFPEEENQE